MRAELTRLSGKQERQVPHRKGFGPGLIHPDDTFIVSFPKSGNTWVRFLIAAMRHPKETVTFRNIERFVPDIHKTPFTIHKMAPPRYIKSHIPSFHEYPRFVYLLRDGRDAMVSYYHYSVDRGWFEGSLREFVDRREGEQFGSWTEHVGKALEFAARHPERMLLVRYEGMLEAPMQYVKRIAEFCRLETPDRVVAQAVERCSFNRLRKMEREFGGEVEGPAQFKFFRVGAQGQWREESIREQMGSFIADAGKLLSRLGYDT